MKISFIGAGRVGFTLGKYFTLNGLSVMGFFSRNMESAVKASEFVGCSYFESLDSLVKNSDIIFVTTNDDSIPVVWDQLKSLNLKDKIICHCSGSLSSNIFSETNNSGAYQYSIHPMYPFKDKYTSYKDFKTAYFSIEGHPDKLNFVKTLLSSLGNEVIEIDSNKKAQYHLSNVMVSNLVLGLLKMGVDTLTDCGVDFDDAKNALMPLIKSNIQNISCNSFEDSITGPLLRGDVETLKKHMDCMTENQMQVYKILSKNLLEISKNKLPQKDYGCIENLLDSANADK